MKIMIQDRTMIVEQPKQVYVTSNIGQSKDENGNFNKNSGLIMSNNQRCLVMAEYHSVDRAMEVLKEIFEYQRRGKRTYYMPQK